ncbi:hypothetical protein VNO78_11570 [Psophocarpus tetragonolobus]|uniref:Uncharacterized protein n=1 Tax=Psophocarpus tetragonolobus TaxID=3891 RepID=A0AAN9SLP4_PSOTE
MRYVFESITLVPSPQKDRLGCGNVGSVGKGSGRSKGKGGNVGSVGKGSGRSTGKCGNIGKLVWRRWRVANAMSLLLEKETAMRKPKMMQLRDAMANVNFN